MTHALPRRTGGGRARPIGERYGAGVASSAAASRWATAVASASEIGVPASGVPPAAAATRSSGEATGVAAEPAATGVAAMGVAATGEATIASLLIERC